MLIDAGISFTYVGDTGPPDYPGHFYGGIWIEDYYPSSFGNGWGTGVFDTGPALELYHPDIILIHLGTNNMAAIGPGDPIGPYSEDGGETLLYNPTGIMAEFLLFILSCYDGYPADIPLIVLSQIIPRADRMEEVAAFNSYLEEMALDMAYGVVTGAPVHVVICDHHTPFIENPLLFTGQPGDYMDDTVHPNDLGYHVMAETYFASLLDETPPAAVTDLTVWGQGPHSVKLWWTATGDDYLSGIASHVDVRFLTEPIDNDVLFSQAWELVLPVGSDPPGITQQLIGQGLPGGGTYWMALKLIDDAGNASELSNSPFVTIEQSDSLVWTFEEEASPDLWGLGGDYSVVGGVLGPANPQPIWLPPALFSGETAPWDVELELEETAPPGETGLVGLVLMADMPTLTAEGFVVFCEGGILKLHSLQSGMIGAVVDTATSHYGPLAAAEELGAIPFISEGSLFVRTLRNSQPDRILDTGQQAIQLPNPRYAGVVMRGGLSWGVDRFCFGGPGLWEPPSPFHLLSPDSGAVVEDPPVLSWYSADDPDPWDEATYTVSWSTSPDFPAGLTYEISTNADTFVDFPAEEFIEGHTYHWRVKVTDATDLDTLSIERGWWFQADTNHAPQPFALLSPARGESVTTQTPILVWSRSLDPDEGDTVTYSVTVSLETDLSSPAVYHEGVLDTTQQVGPLELTGPWYWSVVARDGTGATTSADTSYFYLHSSGSEPMPGALVIGSPFPNPATSTVTIPVTAPVPTQAIVELMNLAGRRMLVEEQMIPQGTVATRWSLPQALPEATYVLKIRANSLVRQFPLLLRR
jgi:hypothetical protein